ncbi:agrin [Rhinolophus ferrumequinum]|uniref:Agrin n=1 Tax=Rhinolophus ferrumequinum TaxID=59479 RepID=A0A7J7X2X5_RHIFE|nr:agrin [Rhinolophus ferrumequinum]
MVGRPGETACGPGPAEGIWHRLRGLPAGRGGGAAATAPAGGRSHQARASALFCPVSLATACCPPCCNYFLFL